MNAETYAKLMRYIDHNPMAVLGTINDDGTPHGAVVYVCNLSNRTICFVTKNGTQKYNNLIAHPAVSLTIGNDQDGSTLQAAGKAFVVKDPALLNLAMEKINEIQATMVDWLPPLAKLRAGSYTIIGIELRRARLGEFNGRSIGSEEIFTEM